MNIALIGHRGTGKTSIAKLLTKKLDKKLISTDEEVSKKLRTNIPNFVRKKGWEKYHEIESEVIENLSDYDECVFDTGCCAIIRNENVINLKKSSLIIMLTSDSKTLASRQKKSNPNASYKKYFDDLASILQKHEPKFANAADYTIDTSRLSPEEACNLIMHYIQMELK